MKILKETVSVKPKGQLYCITLHQPTEICGEAVEMGGQLWLEQKNLDWLRGALLQQSGAQVSELTCREGMDELQVFQRGDRGQQFIHIINKRKRGSEQSGTFAIGLSLKTVTTLVQKLVNERR